MNWIASLILTAGVIDDFRSRKVHNWLAATALVLALATSFFTGGALGLQTAVLGALASFVVFLPLVMLKIVGAGDLKLFVAFGAAVNWNTVLYVAFYAIVWGAVFGVAQVLMKKQGFALLNNIKTLTVQRKSEGVTLHSIPFTVALLMGWLSFLKLEGHV